MRLISLRLVPLHFPPDFTRSKTKRIHWKGVPLTSSTFQRPSVAISRGTLRLRGSNQRHAHLAVLNASGRRVDILRINS